jgi:hypothetical protein
MLLNKNEEMDQRGLVSAALVSLITDSLKRSVRIMFSVDDPSNLTHFNIRSPRRIVRDCVDSIDGLARGQG